MQNDIRDLLETNWPAAELDDIDHSLIESLYSDATVSQRMLGATVGMSAPAVAERVARLERLGVVRRKTVELNWSALGYPMLVLLAITAMPNADLRVVSQELAEIPALTELLLVAGPYDMMARFRLKDHTDLQRLLVEEVWPIAGIQRVETMLSIGRLARDEPLRRVLGDPPVRATPRRRRSDQPQQEKEEQ